MKRLPFILTWLAVILTSLTVPADRFGLVYKGNAPSEKFYPDHIENIYFIDDHRIIKLETNTGNTLEYGSVPSHGPMFPTLFRYWFFTGTSTVSFS
jgi:hypothetical protein